jgi:mannitol 2-dehydrogenase
LDKYKQILIERFSNPHIKDNALRICIDGASKFPKFLVPTVIEEFKRGYIPHYFTLSIGDWIRYLRGYDEQNKPIILQDSVAVEHKLDKLATGPKADVKQILSVKQIFNNIAENQQFSEKLE